MSDFKIKVTADLDTSQVEAKLMALQNRKITIQANANGNGLSNMNNSLQQIQNNANNVSASLKGIATANYAQTECQFRYCGTAIPFLTVRSTAR